MTFTEWLLVLVGAFVGSSAAWLIGSAINGSQIAAPLVRALERIEAESVLRSDPDAHLDIIEQVAATALSRFRR